MARNVVTVKLVVDTGDRTTRAIVALKKCLVELCEDQPWNETAAEALECLGDIGVSAEQV